MLPADQRSWYPFAERLAADGLPRADVRLPRLLPRRGRRLLEGHEADRRGSGRPAGGGGPAPRDEGIDRVGIAGASMGGTAALMVAAADPHGIPAVVTLSAPQALYGLGCGPRRAGAASRAPSSTSRGSAIRRHPSPRPMNSRRMSPQPMREEIVTSPAHGTDLLTSTQGRAGAAASSSSGSRSGSRRGPPRRRPPSRSGPGSTAARCRSGGPGTASRARAGSPARGAATTSSTSSTISVMAVARRTGSG